MGITFERDLQIAGYRPSVVKNALRGFMRTHSPGNIVDLKSIFCLRRDGAIVFEECLDRGLILLDGDGFKITDKGEALIRGKAKPRTQLAQAQALLDDFLQRVDQLNSDAEAVRYVDEVWLFGSLMRREKTVGDIDLALVTTRRAKYQADYEGMQRHLDRVLSTRKDVPVTRGLVWSAEHWITERALFGAKRHPLYAGVQEGISDLASLGVPCRLIYDRLRGGRVDDPILDRHPKSNGRRDDIDPPTTMPDLVPSIDLRPMDARWVAGFCSWGSVSPYCIFRGWTDDAHRLFPRYPDGLRVLGDGYELHSYPWAPRRLKSGGLDARSAILLANATPHWGTSIVLRRRIDRTSATWTLRASFEDLELHRSRTRVNVATLSDMAAAAALILAVDAERIIRRVAEDRSDATMLISLGGCQNEDVNEYFVRVVKDHLQSRAIRIEPDGWRGPPVAVESL